MTRVLVTGTDRPIGKAIVPRLVKYDFTPVACVGDMAGPVMSIDHDLTADGQQRRSNARGCLNRHPYRRRAPGRKS